MGRGLRRPQVVPFATGPPPLRGSRGQHRDLRWASVKRCPKCDTEKEASEFHRRARAKDGLAVRCKECVAAYDRSRYQASSAAAIERARIWQETNRDRKAAISRRWAAANRESASEAVRQWNIANPDRVRKIKRDAQQRRRALQEGAYREEWTTVDILERDDWQCRIPHCRCPDGRAIDPAAEYRWRGTVDHIVPLSRGGDDVLANLRAAHQTCNSAKRAWLDDERAGKLVASSDSGAPLGPFLRIPSS
jgi:5-methylcytosine-specific restriction endonuclease McrA